ncbi:hypothetical protein ACFW91_25775 [Streptomyces asoensis]
MLAEGLRPCTHCRPDAQLDIPGSTRGTTPTTPSPAARTPAP